MEIDNEQLSQAEREEMRRALGLFMSEHPARAPFHLRLMDEAGSALEAVRGAVRLPRAQFAGAVGLAVVILGVGTSYAAESALPGDALYPIKIHVNEKVAEALAPTAVSRAEVVAAHTLRRLQEAETLAAQSRLTASTSAEIRSVLQDSKAMFDESVAAVAHAPGGVALAADLQSDLEVALSSHARVLSVIQAAMPQASAPLTPILATVVAHAEEAKQAQAEADSAIAASTSSQEADDVAHTERANAEHALSQVRSLIAETEQALGTTSARGVAQRALDAEEALNTGNANLRAGDPLRATNAFRAAIRTAAETKSDVETAVHLKNILPLFNASSTESSDAATGD